MCIRWYTWWLEHLSKGKEDRVEKELVALVTEWPDASGVATGRVCYFIQTSGSQTEMTGHVRCGDWTRSIFGPEVSD